MSEGWPSKRSYLSMNVAFFLAIAAFLITFLITVVYRPSSATVADLSRLEVGMTPDQVTAILGEPKISLQTVTTARSNEETWTYYIAVSRWNFKTQIWQLKFFDGKLDSWWQQK